MGSKHKKHNIFGEQFLTTLLSTTLVLILLGTIVFFVLTAQNLSTYVRENINVEVLLNDQLSKEDITSLEKMLRAKPYVKELNYISKEQAAEEITESMGTDPSEFLGYNPFTASFAIKVKAQYSNTASLKRIVRELKNTHKVMDVMYQKDLIDAVNDNIMKISFVLLIIAIIFTYISFSLINNTVRMSIFSQRFTINTMKLVGASWGFIRRPFVYRGLLLGFIAGIAASVLLIIGIESVLTYEVNLKEVVTLESEIIICGAVLVFGILITMLCTSFSLWRYLRLNTNELYHI